MNGRNPRTIPFPSSQTPGAMRSIGAALLVFVAVVIASTCTYIVQPGFRGISVTLGKVSPEFRPEGFGFKQPFVTRIHPMTVRQQTRLMPAPPAEPVSQRRLSGRTTEAEKPQGSAEPAIRARSSDHRLSTR
jgi:regulator of protease activity HflC (stomatin/prohibitin superfamily)